MTIHEHLHVVVLAAGASTRLGQPKQQIQLGGQSLLQQAVSNAVAANETGTVSVVLGAQAAQLAPALRTMRATIVINRQWEEGIAASIRAGIEPLSGGMAGVLIVLADQYAVTVHDLKRLIHAWSGQEMIAASLYQGRLGVPAIFPHWCFSELLTLRGDQGARALIQRHASRVISVPMANAVLDLDTPEDLARLRHEIERDT